MSTFRLPVTVVTGFLGAGKTTLLSNLIKDSLHRRLAILVNEFGEVSIDGTLLRETDSPEAIDIHDLSNGLVAYGDDNDFLPTMQALWARRGTIDHVLIETSGLALPTAIMESLQNEPLSSQFVLDATLAVVDTPLLLAGDFDPTAPQQAIASLFEQQLANADIVVLNKIDELSDDDLLQAETRVRQLAPSIRFIELAYQAKLDTRLTLGLHLHEERSTAHRHYGPVSSLPGQGSQPLSNQSLLNGHSHSGLGAHTHGIATHKHFHEQDPGWQSFTLRTKAEQDMDTLQQAIHQIARELPILRTKGFVYSTTAGQRLLLQAVRSRVVVETKPDDGSKRVAQLVFIGYHPSRPAILEKLKALTGTEWF